MSGLTWLAWAPQEHQHMASHSFSWWWTRMWWQGSRFVLCAAPWRWRWRYRHHPNRLQSLSHCICNILGSKTYCEEQSTHVFNVFIGSQCVQWEPLTLTQDFICRISKKCSHAKIFYHDFISYRTPEHTKKTLIEKCHTALSSPAHARTCSNVPKAASSVSVGRTERTAIQSNGCKHLWNFRHSALWWVDSPNALANGQTSQNTKDPSYEQQGTQRNHGDMNLESKTAAGKLTSVKLK